MRITKIKVKVGNEKPKQQISLFRNENKGLLLHTNTQNQINISQVFNQKANITRLKTSICNKTLVFNTKTKKYQCPYLCKIIKNLLGLTQEKLHANDSFKNLCSDIDEIKKCIKPRFHKTLLFGENKSQTLDLVQLIASAGNVHPSQYENHFKTYRDWASWYTAHVQSRLEKSIEKNKIYVASTQNTPSERMKALDSWARTLVNSSDINFDSLENDFELEKLCNDLKNDYNTLVVNLPTNRQDFNCGIKEVYKAHRRNLCQKNVLRGETQQYSLEVGKYLDLYFPVKSSNKKKSFSVEYINYYLDFNTIKKYVRAKVQNAVMQYLIQQGKYSFYGYEQYTTTVLQEIKSREAFCLQFIEACAFATNNLRNAIDTSSKNDILTKEILKKSLEGCLNNTSTSICKITPFFSLQILDDDCVNIGNAKKISSELTHSQNFISFIAAIRSSIQSIRNEVVHFKKEAYANILNIKSFEGFIEVNGEIENCPASCSYSSSYLAKLMTSEVDLLPVLFAEKIKSSGLLEWYSLEDILQKLSHFELFSRPLAFIPSFKKVFNFGKNLQFSEGKQSENIYKLGIYFNEYTHEHNSAEFYQAKRSAYKFVYENYFMKYFLDKANLEFFEATVKDVKDFNQVHAKKPHEFAFAEVPLYSEKDKWLTKDFKNNPQGYLQSLQSKLIDEENKKRDENTLKEDETGHFQKFLYYLFMKGFDSYISTKTNSHFDFIDKPTYQFSGTDSEKTHGLNQRLFEFRKAVNEKTKVITHSINSANDGQIAFWTLCKMLDAQHLNELQNQISKLKQAIEKDVIASTPHTTQSLQICQEIIALCLLSNDSCYAEPKIEDISWYVGSDAQSSEVYLQANMKSPVLFAGVKLAEKYASKAILGKVLENSKVTMTDISNWEQSKKNIAQKVQERERLHNEWAETEKNKDRWIHKYVYDKNTKKNKRLNELTDNAKRYIALCEEIDHYNWLDNKVHLVHVKKLHDLLIEILGRFVGFVQLWERDFRFLNNKLDENFIPFTIPEDLSIQKTKDNRKNFLYLNFLSPINTSSDKRTNSSGNWREKRNYIAHYGYIFQETDYPFQKKNETLKMQVTILDLLCFVRSLVSYDRKLKNAVTKSFIDILSKHGLDIKFKALHESNHEFVIEKLEPKKIPHLKSNKIEVAQVSQEYADMVRALLEYHK